MANKGKFKSEAFSAIHESASALRDIGAISKQTMREYDELCLTAPSRIAPAGIKRLRLKYNVSQPLFARYLNTSESTVEKWETGVKQPSGVALRLLEVVQNYGLDVLQAPSEEEVSKSKPRKARVA
ncbi:MAG TPA: DNA-binding transcriptional regulator [Rhizomicrobium sp.]|nr:DNA-binding transcriptional regulator [Rhizomicrobium sp.]